jgi:hypothetical protein
MNQPAAAVCRSVTVDTSRRVAHAFGVCWGDVDVSTMSLIIFHQRGAQKPSGCAHSGVGGHPRAHSLERFAMASMVNRRKMMRSETLCSGPTTNKSRRRRPHAWLPTHCGRPVRWWPRVSRAVVATTAHDGGNRSTASCRGTPAARRPSDAGVGAPVTPRAARGDLRGTLGPAPPRRGVCLSVASRCRVLQRLGLPRKTSPCMPPNAPGRG